ncbi:MAG: hypothetical protein RML73_07905 [Anaerolineae bacterium]|nr:hypothetical protein [Anaerolineae bacterium]
MKRLLRLILGLSLLGVPLPVQAQPGPKAKPINLILAFDISGSMYQSTDGLGRWADQALRMFYLPGANPIPLAATDPNNRRFDAAEAALRWLQAYQEQRGDQFRVSVSAFTYRQTPSSSFLGERLLDWQPLDSLDFARLNRPPSTTGYTVNADIRADYTLALGEANALASALRNEDAVVIFITDSIHCPYEASNAGCTSLNALNAAADRLPSVKSGLREYYLFIGPGGEAQSIFEQAFSQQTDRFKRRAAASGGKFLHVAGVNSLTDGLMSVILREVARASELDFDRMGEDPVRDDFSALGVYRWATRDAAIPPYQVRLNAVVSTDREDAAVGLTSADRELSIQEPHGRANLVRFIRVDTPPPGPIRVQVEGSFIPIWVSYEAARAEVRLDPSQAVQYQHQRLVYLILDGDRVISNADYQPVLRAIIEGTRPNDRIELSDFNFERYGDERLPAFISEPFLLTEANFSYGVSWVVQAPDSDGWPKEVSYDFLNVPEGTLRPRPISFSANFEADTDISDDALARSYPLRLVLSGSVDGKDVPLPEGLRAALQLEAPQGADDACPALQGSERLLHRREDGLQASRELRFDVAGQCQIGLALTLEDDLLRTPDRRLSLPAPRNVPRTFVITPTQRLDVSFVQTRFEALGFPIFTEWLSPNQTELTLEIQDVERNRERVRGVFDASTMPFGLEILSEGGNDLAKARGLAWSLKDDGTYRFTIDNLPPGRYVVNATLDTRAQRLNLDRYEYDPNLPDRAVRQAEIEVSLNMTVATALSLAALVVLIVLVLLWRAFQRRRAPLRGYLVIYKTQGNQNELLWWCELKHENIQRFGATNFKRQDGNVTEMARLNIKSLIVSTRREFQTARLGRAYVFLKRNEEGERNDLIEEGKKGMSIYEDRGARYVLGKVKTKPDPSKPATFVVTDEARVEKPSQAR